MRVLSTSNTDLQLFPFTTTDTLAGYLRGTSDTYELSTQLEFFMSIILINIKPQNPEKLSIF